MVDDDRQDILRDATELLRDVFVLEQWGRMLVELTPDETGELRVSDVQVEEIMGDEEALERAFASPEARAVAPAIGKVVEALLSFDDVDVEAVGGGTFVRLAGREPPEVAFLPGLVRTPSPAFDQARDAVVLAMRATAASLRDELGIGVGAALSVDNEAGTIEIARDGRIVARGRHVVLGSFSRPHRSWAWGAFNPSLSPSAQKRAAEVLDAVSERSSWEISTRGFATDEATAWALAGWVVMDRKLVAALRVDVAEGFVALGLLELKRI